MRITGTGARRGARAPSPAEALEREGRADLAADILWVAREAGDGAGYDIRSFGIDGRVRYIEVKATKLGALTPFCITSAELDFASTSPRTRWHGAGQPGRPAALGGTSDAVPA